MKAAHIALFVMLVSCVVMAEEFQIPYVHPDGTPSSLLCVYGESRMPDGRHLETSDSEWFEVMAGETVFFGAGFGGPPGGCLSGFASTQACEYARDHYRVELRVIPPGGSWTYLDATYLNVYMVPAEEDDHDRDRWMIGWFFVFPPGSLEPGIHLAELTWVLADVERLECGFDGEAPDDWGRVRYASLVVGE